MIINLLLLDNMLNNSFYSNEQELFFLAISSCFSCCFNSLRYKLYAHSHSLSSLDIAHIGNKVNIFLDYLPFAMQFTGLGCTNVN
jgi:hypothetical protein